MESIGGTTYFYTQQGQQQPAVVRIILLLKKKPLVKLIEKILFYIWLSLSGKHVLNVDCNVFCDY